MNPIEVMGKYQREFDSIARVAYFAFRQELTPLRTKYLFDLYSYLYDLPYIDNPDWSFSLEDIKQELARIWIEALLVYEDNKVQLDLLLYLKRISFWGLRDWYNAYRVRTNEGQYSFILDESLLETEYFGINKAGISFQFVHECKVYPFSELTRLERYMIYIYVTHNTPVITLSHAFSRDEKLIRVKFQNLFTKLKELYNVIWPSRNTDRSC